MERRAVHGRTACDRRCHAWPQRGLLSAGSARSAGRQLAALVTVVALVLQLASVQADEDANVVPVWRLTSGQRFSVESSTHRVTEIQVGDVNTVHDVTDRLVLQYAMIRHDNTGAAHLDVRIRSMQRTVRDENGSERSQTLIPQRLLQSPALTMVVAEEGSVVRIPDGAALFRTDSPQTLQAIGQMCRDGVFESWFDLPFRLPVITSQPPFRIPLAVPPPGTSPNAGNPSGDRDTDDASAADSDDTDSDDTDSDDGESNEDETGAPAADPGLFRVDREWIRKQAVALGPAAAVHWHCAYRVDVVEDRRVDISMTATSELIPREAGPTSPLRFEKMQLTASDASGSGTFQLDELSGLPRTIEMQQEMKLSGSARVLSGDQSQQMTFKQSLTQTWIASEFGVQEIRRGVPLSQPVR